MSVPHFARRIELAQPPRRASLLAWIAVAFGGAGQQAFWLGAAILSFFAWGAIQSILFAPATAPRAGAWIVLVLYACPLGAALYLAWRGARRGRLLERGEVGHARLVSKESTYTEVNDKRVYRYTFEFELPASSDASYRASGAPRTVRFTHDTHLGENLEDEPLEPILYDPRSPTSAIALDGYDLTATARGIGASWGMLRGAVLPAINLAALLGCVVGVLRHLV